MREVNQIIGRCIRHQNDYSCVFLVDDRYNEETHISKLSRYIREGIQNIESYSDLEVEIE